MRRVADMRPPTKAGVVLLGMALVMLVSSLITRVEWLRRLGIAGVAVSIGFLLGALT